MTNFKLLFIAIFGALTLASCSDDPQPMEWECPAYDQTEISVEFTPGFYTQALIMAKPGCSGEVTLLCTNYSEIFIDENAQDLGLMGCTATKVGGNGVKFTFKPIDLSDDTTILGMVSIGAKNKNGTTISNLQIGRES